VVCSITERQVAHSAGQRRGDSAGSDQAVIKGRGRGSSRRAASGDSQTTAGWLARRGSSNGRVPSWTGANEAHNSDPPRVTQNNGRI